MLFNSWQFIAFFIVVYSLYRVLDHRWQNRMLLVASYFFYGCWSWRFLSLLWISTAVDYFCGLKIGECTDLRKKKVYLAISVVLNLCFLGFFKYFNFFIGNFESLLHCLGLNISVPLLHIILPVGISFYTFQEISYVVDVYRGDLKPVRKLSDYALFVVYFPHLVAGPIQRPTTLIPQVCSKRTISREQIREGLFLFAWGMFKKIIIADGLAPIANMVFSNQGEISGWQVLLGVYAFAFQIYCDFSGYTDIARGISKLMGFELMVNFNLPYFASSPREFWRRWHISLSTWIRDYLYISLGGNRKGELRTYLNLIVTMTLAGLWHVAAWTFIVWGAYHGLLLAIQRLVEPFSLKVFSFKNRFIRSMLEFGGILLTFHLVCFGWLLFRAKSLDQVVDMVKSLFCNWALDWKTFYYFKELILFVWLLLLFQLFQFFRRDLRWIVSASMKIKVAFAAMAAALVFVIYAIGMPSSQEFIYFQF